MTHHNIHYIEIPSRNLTATKRFFETVFGWKFTDYGDAYTAFEAASAGLDGGFYLSETTSNTENGSSLVILYSDELEQTMESVESAGGKIVKPIFSFPGGRRFQFTEPGGSELSVWQSE